MGINGPVTRDIVERIDAAIRARYGWDESKHPRVPPGSAQGGQFTAASESLPEWWNAKSQNPYLPHMTQGEEIMDWLTRHTEVKPNGDGTYRFFHGSPNPKLAELAPGSYLIDNENDARFFAARDRGLNPRKMHVYTVDLKPWEIQTGVFATLRGRYVVRTPAAKGEWREELHPRHPAGSEAGGEFAPKDGAEAGPEAGGEVTSRRREDGPFDRLTVSPEWNAGNRGKIDPLDPATWTLDNLPQDPYWRNDTLVILREQMGKCGLRAKEIPWLGEKMEHALAGVSTDGVMPSFSDRPGEIEPSDLTARYLKWRTGIELSPKHAIQFWTHADWWPKGPAQYVEEMLKPVTGNPSEVMHYVGAKDADSEVWGGVTKGAEAIDAVHTVEGLLPQAIVLSEKQKEYSEGHLGESYNQSGYRMMFVESEAKDYGDVVTPEWVLTHEFGHALEADAFGNYYARMGRFYPELNANPQLKPADGLHMTRTRKDDSYFSDSDPAEQRVGVRDLPSRVKGELFNLTLAINESKNVKELWKYANSPGDGEEDSRKRAYARSYMLCATELFARAYTQWIGTRSGNPRLTKPTAWYANQPTVEWRYQWTDEDFKPIARAMDNLFRAKGWLKETTETRNEAARGAVIADLEKIKQDSPGNAMTFETVKVRKPKNTGRRKPDPARQPSQTDLASVIDARIRAVKGEWREELHPRHPAGSEAGGEFAPKFGYGGGNAPTEGRAEDAPLPEPSHYDSFGAEHWRSMLAMSDAERQAEPLTAMDMHTIASNPASKIRGDHDLKSQWAAVSAFLKWRTGVKLDQPETLAFIKATSHATGDLFVNLNAPVLHPSRIKTYLNSPRSGPGGNVSDAVNLQHAPEGTRADIERALAAIDKAHGDGDLPGIVVDASDTNDVAAASWVRAGFPRIELSDAKTIRKNDANVTGAVVHEMGHTLDYMAFAGRSEAFGMTGTVDPDTVVRISQRNYDLGITTLGNRYLTRDGHQVTEAEARRRSYETAVAKNAKEFKYGMPANTPEVDKAFDRVMLTINNSQRAVHLFEMTREGHRFVTSRGAATAVSPRMASYTRGYLLSGPEMFARAYMQYVGLRSGDKRVIAMTRRNLTETGTIPARHWEDGDFEPIAAAFDDLFRAKGWLKESPAAKGEWREELHPREAAGSPEGGQFTEARHAPPSIPPRDDWKLEALRTQGHKGAEYWRWLAGLPEKERHAIPWGSTDWETRTLADTGVFPGLSAYAASNSVRPDTSAEYAKFIEWRTGVDLTPPEADLFAFLWRENRRSGAQPADVLKYTRTEPVKPGATMSEAVMLDFRDAREQGEVAQAMRDIDNVHGVSDIPRFWIEQTPVALATQGSVGSSAASAGLARVRLAGPKEMKDLDGTATETAYHEVGHMLDTLAFDNASMRWVRANRNNRDRRLTVGGNDLDESDNGRAVFGDRVKPVTPEVGKAAFRVMSVINASRRVRQLRAFVDGQGQDVSKLTLHPALSDFTRKYTLHASEVFARAYSQYITRKSGNPIARSAIESRVRPDQAGQWEDDDFAPISDAFDDLFRAKGWLRESPAAKAQAIARIDAAIRARRGPVGRLIDAIDARIRAAKGEWREELHPRHPAGSPQGGEFAASGDAADDGLITSGLGTRDDPSFDDERTHGLTGKEYWQMMAALAPAERHSIPWSTRDWNVYGLRVAGVEDVVGVNSYKLDQGWHDYPEEYAKFIEWRTGTALTPNEAELFHKVWWENNNRRPQPAEMFKYTRTEAVGPGGKVSDAAMVGNFDNVKQRAAVFEALADIDKVHGDGEIPKFWIESYGRPTATMGSSDSHMGMARIELNTPAAIKKQWGDTRETLYHEVGHMLDATAFGNATLRWAEAAYTDSYNDRYDLKLSSDWINTLAWRAGATAYGDRIKPTTPEVDQAFNRVMDAANKSQYVASLSKVVNGEGFTGPRGGTVKPGPRYREFVEKYILGSQEVFARAYSQYVALRSGNPKARAVIEKATRSRGKYVPSHWTDEDFAPIAAAMDDLFRAKGWLKEPQAAKGEGIETGSIAAGELAADVVTAIKGEWREELHPRAPAGGPEGGQFARKNDPFDRFIDAVIGSAGPSYRDDPKFDDPRIQGHVGTDYWTWLAGLPEEERHSIGWTAKDWLTGDAPVKLVPGTDVDAIHSPTPYGSEELAKFIEWRTGVSLTPVEANQFQMIWFEDGDRRAAPSEVLEYTRTQSAGPGAKISESAILGRFNDTGPREEARQALADIDKAHSDGEIPRFVIEQAVGETLGLGQAYVSEGMARIRLGTSWRIETDGGSITETVYHEVGHTLDVLAFNGGTTRWAMQRAQRPGQRLTSNGPDEIKIERVRGLFGDRIKRPTAEVDKAFDRVMEAIESSARIGELSDAADGLGYRGARGGIIQPSKRYREFVRSYTLSAPEAFARAYSQFIAVTANNPKARATIKLNAKPTRDVAPRQWDDADFEPIEAAFIDLFRAKGWHVPLSAEDAVRRYDERARAREAAAAKALTDWAVRAGAWREDLHPRAPAGMSEGGQFVAKDGAPFHSLVKRFIGFLLNIGPRDLKPGQSRTDTAKEYWGKLAAMSDEERHKLPLGQGDYVYADEFDALPDRAPYDPVRINRDPALVHSQNMTAFLKWRTGVDLSQGEAGDSADDMADAFWEWWTRGDDVTQPQDMPDYFSAPSKPGTLISSDVILRGWDTPAGKKAAAQIRAGLAAIDAVHGNGDAPKMVIQPPISAALTGNGLDEAGASYMFEGQGRISIGSPAAMKANKATVAGVVVHEIGHSLDGSVFGGETMRWRERAGIPDDKMALTWHDAANEAPLQWPSWQKYHAHPATKIPDDKTRAAFDNVMATINNSRHIQAMARYVDKGTLVMGKDGEYVPGTGVAARRVTEAGRQVTVADKTETAIYTRYYLLNDQEAFARAYTQYVGLRSGDAEVLKMVKANQRTTTAGFAKQWQDDEFEPIAKAFDALFEAKGWRAKGATKRAAKAAEAPDIQPADPNLVEDMGEKYALFAAGKLAIEAWFDWSPTAVQQALWAAGLLRGPEPAPGMALHYVGHRDAAKGEWREELHPRHPAGSPEGGEFRFAFGGPGGDAKPVEDARFAPIPWPEDTSKLVAPRSDGAYVGDHWRDMAAMPQAKRHSKPWTKNDFRMIARAPTWRLGLSDAENVAIFVKWRTGESLNLAEATTLLSIWQTGEDGFAPREIHQYMTPPVEGRDNPKDVIDVSRLPAPQRTDAEHTVALIGQVHKAQLGNVIVDPMPGKDKSSNRNRPNGQSYAIYGALRITLDDKSGIESDRNSTVNTLAHEFGHVLDAAAFENRGSLWVTEETAKAGKRGKIRISTSGPERWGIASFDKWAETTGPIGAVRNTPKVNAAYDKLMVAINESDAVKQVWELAHDKKRGYAPSYQRSAREYHLNAQEVFARAYTQYIATKTGDSQMMAKVRKEAEPTTLWAQDQWADDDFRPIAEAFDDLFRAKGWLKESKAAKAMGTGTAEAFAPATQRGAQWREELHPRHSAGRPDGGEFAPKGGGAKHGIADWLASNPDLKPSTIEKEIKGGWPWFGVMDDTGKLYVLSDAAKRAGKLKVHDQILQQASGRVRGGKYGEDKLWGVVTLRGWADPREGVVTEFLVPPSRAQARTLLDARRATSSAWAIAGGYRLMRDPDLIDEYLETVISGAPGWDELPRLRAAKGEWREELHPREAAGSPQGGEFTFAYGGPKDELTGPSGETVVGHEWVSKIGEKYSTKEGGIIEAVVSDWEGARVNPDTGRQIVHVFHIRDADGAVRTYSEQSFRRKFGISSGRVSKVVLALDRKAAEWRQQVETARRTVQSRERSASAAEALTEYRTRNKYTGPMDHVVVMRNGERFLALNRDTPEIEAATRDGWVAVVPEPERMATKAEVDAWLEALKAEWDESKHPRAPAGRSEGGRFIAKNAEPEFSEPMQNEPVPDVPDATPPDAETVAKRIAAVERDLEEWQVTEPWERGVVIDRRTGKVLFDMVGDETSSPGWFVGKLGEDDGALLHYHTHPGARVNSFSDGDWGYLSFHTISAMRVVTAGHTYELEKTDKWDAMDWRKRTPRALRDRWNAIVDDEMTRPGEGLTIDQEVERAIEATNKRMAEEYGVRYTDRPWGVRRDAAKGEWREELHPRHPAGTEAGGEFAPKYAEAGAGPAVQPGATTPGEPWDGPNTYHGYYRSDLMGRWKELDAMTPAERWANAFTAKDLAALDLQSDTPVGKVSAAAGYGQLAKFLAWRTGVDLTPEGAKLFLRMSQIDHGAMADVRRIPAYLQPPLGPGAKVSETVDFVGGRRNMLSLSAWREMRSAIDDIDKVHGDGELPRIQIEEAASVNYDTAAGMSYASNGIPLIGIAPDLDVGQNNRTVAGTVVHEYGHALEAYAFSNLAARWGALEPAVEGATRRVNSAATVPEILSEVTQYDEVMPKTVVREQPKRVAAAFDRLMWKMNDSQMVRRLHDIAMNTGPVSVADVSRPERYRQWVGRYLLSGPELFARGYMQYIAARTGNKDIRQDVGWNNKDNPLTIQNQWDDDDFEPIARAYDDLFRAKGWLKESREYATPAVQPMTQTEVNKWLTGNTSTKK